MTTCGYKYYSIIALLNLSPQDNRYHLVYNFNTRNSTSTNSLLSPSNLFHKDSCRDNEYLYFPQELETIHMETVPVILLVLLNSCLLLCQGNEASSGKPFADTSADNWRGRAKLSTQFRDPVLCFSTNVILTCEPLALLQI